MSEDQQPRYSSNVEIAGEVLELTGKAALDIGCGEGRFTRFLAKSGTTVTGLDINAKSLAKAAEKAAEDGVTVDWKEGSADALPFADESLDIVVYSNSLHHIALDRMDAALAEAGRVLKPGGVLYIMEPVARGNWFEATRLINDETVVRDRALDAIARAQAAGFEAVDEIWYRAERRVERFEDYANQQAARSEKRRQTIAERGDEARALFEAAARREDGAFVFDQLFRINYLRKPT